MTFLSQLTLNDDHTSREIALQPTVWGKVAAQMADERAALDAWLAPLLARPDLRIILTGAGSSSYIGEIAAPELTRAMGRLVEAVSTTSIVGYPYGSLRPKTPTLLVSFSRSGGSPESMAAVDIANQVIEECYHLVICCNPGSPLCGLVEGAGNAFTFVLPAEANDQGFAMTASVSGMLVAVCEAFAPGLLDIPAAAKAAAPLVEGAWEALSPHFTGDIKKLVFLGTGAYQGFAREAALKVLELSAGATDCYAESSLGFRHGPKFTIDAETCVVMLPSHDPYARKYDEDLHNELVRDNAAKVIVRLDMLPSLQEPLHNLSAGLVYLTWCQLLGYHNSIACGVTPDNPSPSGQLNRVVKGVTVHALEG